jgi:site-specific recombinase XerD
MTILSNLQVRRLIHNLDPEFKDMVTLMYCSALRINEVASLLRSQVNMESETFQVCGKRNRWRRLPFTYGVPSIFSRALAANRAIYVFERSYSYPFGVRQIRQAIYDAAKRAGLSDVHPHTLRHSRATSLMDGGCDLWHVKQLLGHADIRTTEIYLHYSVEGLRKAMS